MISVTISAMRYRRHTRQRDMAPLMATANVRLSVTGFVYSDRSDGYGHAYDHVVFYLETKKFAALVIVVVLVLAMNHVIFLAVWTRRVSVTCRAR